MSTRPRCKDLTFLTVINRRLLMLAVLAAVFAGLALAGPAYAQGPDVQETDPAENEVAAPLDTDIKAMFADPIGSFNDNDFVVHGRYSGKLSGNDSHEDEDRTIILNLDENLFPGETVFTSLTDGIEYASGNPITPYVWQFTAQTEGGGYIDSSNPVEIGGSSDQYFDVAWADYDGDGDLDLAVARGGGQSYVYPNNGNGTFGTGLTFGGATDWTYAVDWGDADNDGDPGLAVGINGAQNRFCRNQGTYFFCTTPMADSLKTYDVEWGDFNNDGNLDLAVANYQGQNYVYPGNGNGTFGTAVPFGTGSDYSSSISWGDCNQDGCLDLAVANSYYNQDQVSAAYINNQSGGFGSAINNIGVVNDNGTSVAFGDFNGDNDLDLAWGMNHSGSSPQGHSTVFLGTGSCNFSSASAVEFGSDNPSGDPDQIRSLAWGDYDGDGDLDLVASNLSAKYSAVYPNNGDGSLGSAVPFGGASQGTQSIALGDFTGDGNLDIAAANAAGKTYVYSNDDPPPPTLTAHSPITNTVAAPLDSSVVLTYSAEMSATTVTSQTVAVHSMMQGMVTAAPSTDGSVVTVDPDDFFPGELVYAVATTYTTDLTGTHPLSATQWQFTAGSVYNRCYAGFLDIEAGLTGTDFGAVAWGDYDKDGDLDILLTGRTGSANISKVYRNDGHGAFTDMTVDLTGVRDSFVAWGDYDNDGDPDILLTGNTGSANISKVYRNDGAGGENEWTFTDIAAGLEGVNNGSASWGDYDNDGDLDILLTGNYMSKVYRNDGNETFTDMTVNLTGVTASSAQWGDYDNDGDLDIVLAGYTGSVRTTKLYRNDGAGGTDEWTFTDIAAGLTDVNWPSLAWGDYDRDGDLDILLIPESVTAYDQG